MKNQNFYFNFILTSILLLAFLIVSADAQNSVVKTVQTLRLGETEIRINIFEKRGANVTFFSPHHNEQLSRQIAKELVGKNSGRLVEVESLDENGKPARRLQFKFRGKSYSIDPNRIFTPNGLRCTAAPEVNETITQFATDLLKIIFVPTSGGYKLREGEKFLVAIHNNADVDRLKNESEKAKDLTAFGFVKAGRLFSASAEGGAFQEQVAGVYLSNVESDEDNFIFLSTASFLSFFAEKGFNVAVQKPSSNLQSENCDIDDGSLSVFAGQRNLPYINVEADAVNGSVRQLQMLKAIYELLQKMSENESSFTLIHEKSETAGAIR